MRRASIWTNSIELANARIVINEVMINPLKAADLSTQWFELYNTNSTSIALNKWKLLMMSNSMSANFVTLTTTKVMSPYSYLVIGNNGNSATNGGITVDIELTFEKPFPEDGRGSNYIALYAPGASWWEDVVYWGTATPQVTIKPGASFAKVSAIAEFSDWDPSTSFINCNSGSDKGTPGKINTFVCPRPTKAPTKPPTKAPTKAPTKKPTKAPTKKPTKAPTKAPITSLTKGPTKRPTKAPTKTPIKAPTKTPIKAPGNAPTMAPTNAPTGTKALTRAPTKAPTVEATAPKAGDAPVAAPVGGSPTAPPVEVAPSMTAAAPNASPVIVAPMAAPVPAAPTMTPAKAPTSTSPEAPTPSSKKCGLFRLSILCLNGCGILGRLLGICPN